MICLPRYEACRRNLCRIILSSYCSMFSFMATFLYFVVYFDFTNFFMISFTRKLCARFFGWKKNNSTRNYLWACIFSVQLYDRKSKLIQRWKKHNSKKIIKKALFSSWAMPLLNSPLTQFFVFLITTLALLREIYCWCQINFFRMVQKPNFLEFRGLFFSPMWYRRKGSIGFKSWQYYL